MTQARPIPFLIVGAGGRNGATGNHAARQLLPSSVWNAKPSYPKGGMSASLNLHFRPHLHRRGGTAATEGTTGTVDLAEEDHDVVWVCSCRL